MSPNRAPHKIRPCHRDAARLTDEEVATLQRMLATYRQTETCRRLGCSPTVIEKLSSGGGALACTVERIRGVLRGC